MYCNQSNVARRLFYSVHKMSKKKYCKIKKITPNSQNLQC